EKEKLFHQLLQHKKIIAVRSSGLLLAVEFENEELCKKVIDECRRNDLITDWFLFAPHCLRLAPPLIISEEEIISACKKILHSIESVSII
ncbi:MAG TPA: aspartate aminotransferase family protein, partial [Bacteroidetes bacterium]|nr:aspartate aminotransferase family protein [Bacteroidota bacterium]